MLLSNLKNPVKDLPYDEGAFDTFHKYGYLMFPQQRRIYENIKQRLQSYSTVLEVGCGIGLGTAILDRGLTTKIVGTDNLADNVNMAKALYPWIEFKKFDVCDITTANGIRASDVVVAVEVLEHVADPLKAIKNLCSLALKEVWISTPNGRGKKRPPDNPYHVTEYLASEVVDMINEASTGWTIKILDSYFKPSNEGDPLVYHLTKDAQ